MFISECVLALAASSGTRNVMVWRPSVCPSVCLSRRHTHRDSTEGSMRRRQRTFWPDNKEDRHTCFVSFLSGNGIYSQESVEVSRSSKEYQLSAGQSVGGQDHGFWTRTPQKSHLWNRQWEVFGYACCMLRVSKLLACARTADNKCTEW